MTEQMTPDEVLDELVQAAKEFAKCVYPTGPLTTDVLMAQSKWRDARDRLREARTAVAALIARNAELEADNRALRVAAECYKAISTTPMAYDVLKRHGLTAGESPYNFCNRMHDEALARAEASHG